MKALFLNTQIGDIVMAQDTDSRDLDIHFLKVEQIEEDKEFITKTNPKGIVLYGTDLEKDQFGQDYMTLVTECSFLRKANEIDLQAIDISNNKER